MPLGYDARERKLVINAAEAETVRHIFHRYAALRSVNALKADLDASQEADILQMQIGQRRPLCCTSAWCSLPYAAEPHLPWRDRP